MSDKPPAFWKRLIVFVTAPLWFPPLIVLALAAIILVYVVGFGFVSPILWLVAGKGIEHPDWPWNKSVRP